MTQLYLYHCPTAPANRTWIAQYAKNADNLYMTIHGFSADNARAKAELMMEHAALDPKDHKAFDLRGRLAALSDGFVDEDDLL